MPTGRVILPGPSQVNQTCKGLAPPINWFNTGRPPASARIPSIQPTLEGQTYRVRKCSFRLRSWLSSTVLCSLPSLLTELLYLSPLPVTGKCGHKHVANFHHRNTGVFTQQGVKDHTVVWELQFWLSLSPEQPPPASPAFCFTLQYDFAFDAEAKGAYVGQHGPMASALRRLSARNQESSLPHPDNSYVDIFVRLHHGHCRAEKGQSGSVTETLSHMR